MNRTYGPRTQPAKPSTAKQFDLLAKLVTERGPAAKADVDSRLATVGASHPRDLTMDQMSAAIKAVMAMPRTDKATAPRPQAPAQRPSVPGRVDFSTVPASKFALETSPGHLEFFEVQEGKGKWDGYRFVEKLTGAPGDWRRTKLYGKQSACILTKIIEDSYTDLAHPGRPDLTGPRAGQVRFARTHQRCAVCSSPLSDDQNRGKDGLTSMERGIGPVCASK